VIWSWYDVRFNSYERKQGVFFLIYVLELSNSDADKLPNHGTLVRKRIVFGICKEVRFVVLYIVIISAFFKNVETV